MSKAEKIKQIKQALKPKKLKTLRVYNIVEGVTTLVEQKEIEAEQDITIYRQIITTHEEAMQVLNEEKNGY